jgi:hypothetical protein
MNTCSAFDLYCNMDEYVWRYIVPKNKRYWEKVPVNNRNVVTFK